MAIPRRPAVESRIVAHLELHTLKSAKRARQVVLLLDRLHREGARVVVWVGDEGRRQILDDYLWTFEKLAFVPHALWNPSLGEVDDPIVLVGEAVNPNLATVLVVGDDLPPGPWAASFDAVHDFVSTDEIGAARRGFWERWREDPERAGADAT
jgi:DNA polymerase IIIc chi subunit